MIKQPFRVEDSNIIVPAFNNNPSKDQHIPVGLLELIADAGVSFDAIREAYWFHSVTSGRKFEWAKVAELAGMDLSGYAIYWWDDDYERPDWREANVANSIVYVKYDEGERVINEWEKDGWFEFANTMTGTTQWYRLPADMDILLVKRTPEETAAFIEILSN